MWTAQKTENMALDKNNEIELNSENKNETILDYNIIRFLI